MHILCLTPRDPYKDAALGNGPEDEMHDGKDDDVDEGNDDDCDDPSVLETEDVLQGVEQRKEEDVELPPQRTSDQQPTSFANSKIVCKYCSKLHDGVHNKQCEVATRLFERIIKQIGSDTRFKAFEVFVLVPNLNSLYRQTVSRLNSFIAQVQVERPSFLAGRPAAGRVFKASLKGLENRTNYSEMEKMIKARQDTLFLLIHDEAHYEATRRQAVDTFINSTFA